MKYNVNITKTCSCYRDNMSNYYINFDPPFKLNNNITFMHMGILDVPNSEIIYDRNMDKFIYDNGTMIIKNKGVIECNFRNLSEYEYSDVIDFIHDIQDSCIEDELLK